MKHLKISAFLFAAIVAVGVFAVLAVCMARADARPPNRDMDLYLLIGQSNMAGRGALTEANCISTELVFKLGKSGNWEEATEPIHFDKTSAGAGLAASFARTMADRDPSVKIGLVPCAVGGSHMKTWVKGGVNYSNAVVRLRKALGRGVLKGILWHQGEGDATDAAETAAWAEIGAKRLYTKDLKNGGNDVRDLDFMLGGGFSERSRSPNSYPQTSVDKWPGEVVVYANGERVSSARLPNTDLPCTAGASADIRLIPTSSLAGKVAFLCGRLNIDV